jgi:hypothetical protein
MSTDCTFRLLLLRTDNGHLRIALLFTYNYSIFQKTRLKHKYSYRIQIKDVTLDWKRISDREIIGA